MRRARRRLGYFRAGGYNPVADTWYKDLESTMKSPASRNRWMTRAAIGLCAALGMLRAPAQEPPASAPVATIDVLRPEVQATRPLYNPDTGIWLRFVLHNSSDQCVIIPLDYPVNDGGLGLPFQLVVGTGTERSLSVLYENEAPKEVPSTNPPTEALEDGVDRVRLAPHGALGTAIDLRTFYPAVRYPGYYKVAWRPFGGRVGTVTAEFRVELRKDVIVVTDLGKLTFAIDYEGAPRNVENFLELVREGFYNGKTIHRVIPGFILQGGCPKSDGTGVRPDNKLIPAELRDIPVETGTLLMAHKPHEPNSASCQFFVALARLKDLDGQYTVIGQAHDEESMRTLQQMAEVTTDTRDRPVLPLVIRSINLVDNNPDRGRGYELQSRNSAIAPSPYEPATRPAATPPAATPQ